VTDDLCRDLFCFAAVLGEPLSQSASADFVFFLRKLEAVYQVENDVVHVAMLALKARLNSKDKTSSYFCTTKSF
jgi:hypothetical protein